MDSMKKLRVRARGEGMSVREAATKFGVDIESLKSQGDKARSETTAARVSAERTATKSAKRKIKK